MEINISKEDFINWYNNQEQKCYYCNRTIEEISQDIRENKNFKGRLSIDRKDNTKGYTLDNIVLACRRCNTIKGDYFTEKEMLKLESHYTHLFLEKNKLQFMLYFIVRGEKDA